MPRPKTAAQAYSAALSIALDRDADPAERAGADRLMGELADEMRNRRGRPARPPDQRALGMLVTEAIAQRAGGEHVERP